MSLEDCIATAAELGARGIEVIGEQMMPGFPKLPDAFFEQWHGWMEKYGTTPVCHDMFLDIKQFKGRQLTEEEMLESVIRDLKFANRLGCTVIRVIVNTPPEIMAKSAPYAEQYNVKMGLEIHSPFTFNHEWIQRHIEVMDKVGSPYLGFIPDMGMFVKRFPRVMSERYIRDGAHEPIVRHIVETYNSHEGVDQLIEEVRQMGGNQVDLEMAESLRYYTWTDPKRLLDFMPRICHIHAKFYEMLEDDTEYSIPYDEIIPILVEGGYSGYLSSEYEGNRHIDDVFEVDSVEQVRRQQEMFKRLLGET
jgi:sugar phosphate isomerase/epimerase